MRGRVVQHDPSSPTKIKVVREALAKVVLEHLRPQDRAKLVVFNDGAEVLFPSQLMTAVNRAELSQMIMQVQAQGDTHFSEAIRLAQQVGVSTGELGQLILLTDGHSTDHVELDLEQMPQLAALSIQQNLPWTIFGTGASYDWNFLETVIHHAVGGSELQHMMSVEELEGALIAQLADMRGVSIDGLRLVGNVMPGVELKSVTRFIPSHRDLSIDPNGFQEAMGRLQGAQHYLVELLVDDPQPGQLEAMWLDFRGTCLSQGRPMFQERAGLNVQFTRNAAEQSTQPHPQVLKYALRKHAHEQEQAGNPDAAANSLDLAGDHRTAAELRTLTQSQMRGDLGEEVTRRGIRTAINRSTLTTEGPVLYRQRKKSRWPWSSGSDSDPSQN